MSFIWHNNVKTVWLFKSQISIPGSLDTVYNLKYKSFGLHFFLLGTFHLVFLKLLDHFADVLL